MGLLGNGFRHNAVGRISTATTNLDGCNASTIPASYNLAAMRRNMLLGSGIANKLASVPSGKRHPNVWLMPKEGGAISSYKRTNMRIDGYAVAEMGLPRGGASSIVFSGNAVGGSIVSATGTATISINGTAAIVATLNTTGSATIIIDGSAVLDAIASITGQTTITVNGRSSIMALGYMTGTTVETGELTPAGIATAVWAAIAASNNASGTMGAKLNTASSGGVDLDALAQAVWEYATRNLSTSPPTAEQVAAAILDAAQATPIHADTRKMNGATVNGDGSSGNLWRGA